MSNVEKRPQNKNIRYILLLLLILLTSLGIWKCPIIPNRELKHEIVQEKEDNLGIDTFIKSDIVAEKNPPSLTNNEIRIAKKEETSIALKSKEENIPNINTFEKNTGILKIENEVFSEKETEATFPNKEFPQKEIVVYKVNKNIDKRSPASSDVSCKATTTLKIAKSSIQTSVAFSPNGTNFAVGNHNNYVSVMNMEGKEVLKLIGHNSYVQSIKYSPDGKFIVTGSVDNTAKLWNASDGKEIKSLEGHTEGILSVAYSLNGKYIATGSLDHTTILWNANSGKKLFQLKRHKSEVVEVTFSTNSKFLITGSSDGTAKVWDVKSGEILFSLEGHDNVVGGVAFTPDNQMIATASADKIRLWNAKTGKHRHTINGNKDSIMSIFISNDGKYITSSSVNGSIKIWKIKGGKEVCKLEGHTTRAREAVFHPINKNTIISASNDKTIRIWKFEIE